MQTENLSGNGVEATAEIICLADHIPPRESRSMPSQQRVLKLTLTRDNGEPQWLHKQRERELNKPVKKTPPEKLLADLLKRQARRIMADITECPPDTIAAHLARLENLTEVLLCVLNHWFSETAEARFSDKQLANPYTLRDHLAALEITRRQHRAPAFVNERDEVLARIDHKLDVLAGLFAQSPSINAVMDETMGGDAA